MSIAIATTPAPHATHRMRASRALRKTLGLDTVPVAASVALRAHAGSVASRIATSVIEEIATSQDDERHLIAAAFEEGVLNFIDIACGEPDRGPHVYEMFRGLGRAAARQHQDLNLLKAAQHVALRVTWEELRLLCTTGALGMEKMCALVDALLIYLQQLQHQATVGFVAGAQGTQLNVLGRRRLAHALFAGRPSAEIESLSEAAGWTLPAQLVVVIAVTDAESTPLPIGVPGHALMMRDGLHAVIAVPADEAPSLVAALGRSSRVAYSWPVEPLLAPDAYRWARRALQLADDGLINETTIDCAAYRTVLWLHADQALNKLATREVLAPLAAEKPQQRRVLAATLLVWLRGRESAPTIARRLGIHEQTVRQRLRRLKQLFGTRLDDPHSVLSLLIVLESGAADLDLGFETA